ncbi:MAG TPA: FmdB family zinc ribbon protein [Acidimicrobiales bacterium]|nr:FmdB family zinc ribbon protein [Acidimicrobiales bacterium]
MPTYEYRCTTCGEHVEVVQSFTDEPLTECPNCGGALRKVFGSIGVVLKGSGFYRNDSRSSGASRSSAREGSDAAKESAGKDAGSSGSDGAAAKGSAEPSAKPDTAAPTKSDAAAG